jgi:large subunit ribosomal protein L19
MEIVMNVLNRIELEQMRLDIPVFRPGDTVKVHVKIREGEKDRIQVFQGVVIARKNAAMRSSFTVRKVSYSVGVEKIFPLHSPSIDRIELVQRGKVRRSRLFYLRDLKGKAARVKVQRY